MMKKVCAALCVLLLLAGCSRQEPPAETPPSVEVPPSVETPQTPPAETPPAQAGAEAAPGAYLTATGAYERMNDPAFWAASCAEPDAVRMTAEEIALFNASVLADPETLCVDLRAYPDTLGRAALTAAIKTYGQVPAASYWTADGPLTGAQQSAISANLGLSAVADSNPVRFGFIVRRAALRTWPSPLELYEEAGDVEYDLARESTLLLWEPVCVLHTSADGAWLLTQAYNYIGWVAAEDVALTDRAAWDALQGRDFFTVRAARLALGDSLTCPALNGTVLTMGVRLPRADAQRVDNATTDNAYAALLPLRADDGTLATAEVRIPFSADVCPGCPALTDRSLLEQVFRLLGERYGWGGMFGGWDCSSICADAYAVFGVRLPRNSSRQIRTGLTHNLSQAGTEEKQALLSSLRPGALLEIRGHMMFWLGNYDGHGYVLHSTYGFQPEGQPFTVANCVTVSSVDVLRAGGGTILENIRAAAEVKIP